MKNKIHSKRYTDDFKKTGVDLSLSDQKVIDLSANMVYLEVTIYD